MKTATLFNGCGCSTQGYGDRIWFCDEHGRAVEFYDDMLREMYAARADLLSILDNIKDDPKAFGGSRDSIISFIEKRMDRLANVIVKAEGR